MSAEDPDPRGLCAADHRRSRLRWPASAIDPGPQELAGGVPQSGLSSTPPSRHLEEFAPVRVHRVDVLEETCRRRRIGGRSNEHDLRAVRRPTGAVAPERPRIRERAAAGPFDPELVGRGPVGVHHPDRLVLVLGLAGDEQDLGSRRETSSRRRCRRPTGPRGETRWSSEPSTSVTKIPVWPPFPHPHEDETVPIGREVAGDVVSTRVGRDPLQAAPVGGADPVDAGQARVVHPEALAGEPFAVRGPGTAAEDLDGRIGRREGAEHTRAGIDEMGDVPVVAAEDLDLRAVGRPARILRTSVEEQLLLVAPIGVDGVREDVLRPALAAIEDDPALRLRSGCSGRAIRSGSFGLAGVRLTAATGAEHQHRRERNRRNTPPPCHGLRPSRVDSCRR